MKYRLRNGGIVSARKASKEDLIRLPKGFDAALPGDYLVVGPPGVKPVCRPDDFNETYEPITGEVNESE